MGYLQGQDVVSGLEGFAQINVNGEMRELFELIELETTIEKHKKEIKVIGRRLDQHKSAGGVGTGSLKFYYITSQFRVLAEEYINTGKDLYFDIIVTNEDPGSSSGKQTIKYTGCNLDSTLLSKIALEEEALEEEADFTFNGFEIIDKFNKPNNV